MLESEGLTQLEVNKGARVPAFDRDELEVIYEMRERIETLALRMSLPLLTADQETELGDLQDRIEASDGRQPVLRPRPTVPPADLRRLPECRAAGLRDPALELHPALSPSFHAFKRLRSAGRS